MMIVVYDLVEVVVIQLTEIKIVMKIVLVRPIMMTVIFVQKVTEVIKVTVIKIVKVNVMVRL